MATRPLTSSEVSTLFNTLVDLEDYPGKSPTKTFTAGRKRLLDMTLDDMMDDRERLDLMPREMAVIASRAKFLATKRRGFYRLGSIPPEEFASLAEAIESSLGARRSKVDER